jgi:hypothetical protein
MFTCAVPEPVKIWCAARVREPPVESVVHPVDGVGFDGNTIDPAPVAIPTARTICPLATEMDDGP